MKIKKLKKVSILILIMLFFPTEGRVWSYNRTTLKEILKHPNLFDRKVVILKGEVIGDILKDSQKGVWINLLSEGYNIGIYVPKRNLLKNVKYLGNYHTKGDIIEVKGIFYKNCPLHAERDIHLLNIEVLHKGYILKENVSKLKEKISISLAIMCLVLVVIYFIRLRYARRY